ncbi:MAG: hypothetical protein H6512_10135 [Acidimicrobiia bacterium]|nr:hypothetical protein [Acidimicrobiia bacterium]
MSWCLLAPTSSWLVPLSWLVRRSWWLLAPPWMWSCLVPLWMSWCLRVPTWSWSALTVVVGAAVVVVVGAAVVVVVGATVVVVGAIVVVVGAAVVVVVGATVVVVGAAVVVVVGAAVVVVVGATVVVVVGAIVVVVGAAVVVVVGATVVVVGAIVVVRCRGGRRDCRRGRGDQIVRHRCRSRGGGAELHITWQFWTVDREVDTGFGEDADGLGCAGVGSWDAVDHRCAACAAEHGVAFGHNNVVERALVVNGELIVRAGGRGYRLGDFK